MESKLDTYIKNRRSVRKFTADTIDEKTIQILVESALWAPSASNMQLCRFIAVTHQEKLNLIKLFSPGMPKSAPCILALCMDLDQAFQKGGTLCRDVTSQMDTAFAAQNILLKACELDLGTCVVKSYNEQSVKKILALPENVSPILLIAIGYFEENPKAPQRIEVSEAICWNQWGEELNGE